MYYTPIVLGSHQLELVFENNHGQSYTITLTINVGNEGAGTGNSQESNGEVTPHLPANDDMTMAIGVPYLGTDGNWYINGQNTGVNSGIDPDGFSPLVEIKNGNWYINGEKSKLPAKEGDMATLTIGKNGNWYINGEDSWIKAPMLNKPNIGVDGNGYYTVDGQSTKVKALSTKEIISNDEYIKQNTITVDPESLQAGQVEVRLVSKQGTSDVEGHGEIEMAGLIQKDGNAIYRVYRNQQPVPNAIVRNMPKLWGKTYTADKAGYFIVPNKDLPYKGEMAPESVNVSINGKNYQSARSTIVPNRMKVGMELMYNIDKDYFFGFTQVQGEKETGIISLPLEVDNMEEYLKDGNIIVNLRGYKSGVFGIRRIFKGVPNMLIKVDKQSVMIRFLKSFRDVPGDTHKVAYYAQFACKGPYGEIVNSSIFLGFGPENPLSQTVGFIDILPF